MTNPNGWHLAAKNSLNVDSVSRRRFYETLWRWSRVRCKGSRMRRSYGTEALLTRQWQQAHLPRASSRSVAPRLSITLAAQRHSNTSSSSASKIELPLARDLRAILRTVPSAAVVLTTTSQVPRFDPTIPKPQNHRGMTLSSFTSLTLSPEPVVTFNIRSPSDAPSPSQTLKAITVARYFLIHILDASPEGARIADMFTKGNETQKDPSMRPFALGHAAGLFDVVNDPIEFQKAGSAVRTTLPRLHGASVRAVFKCELWERSGPSTIGSLGDIATSRGLIRVGDHVMVLGKVQEIMAGGEQEGEENHRHALSYVDGRYRQVGTAVSLE